MQKSIDADLVPSEITDAQRVIWETELKKLTRVGPRINQIFQFLVHKGFDAYVADGKHGAWVTAKLDSVGDSVNLESIQKGIFYRRNKIVHFGELDFTQSDAADCVDATEVMLMLLLEVDDHRRRLLA